MQLVWAAIQLNNIYLHIEHFLFLHPLQTNRTLIMPCIRAVFTTIILSMTGKNLQS